MPIAATVRADAVPLVCWHEAGHALLAHLVGRRIYSVEISGTAGSVRSDRRAGESIFETVAICMAGVVGEHVAGLHRWPPCFDSCSKDAFDAEDAISLHLRASPGADGKHIWARSLSEARRVLTERRSSLRAIAGFLHSTGCASHADILRLTLPRA